VPEGKNLFDIKGHWAEKFVNDMISDRIMSGYIDGTFRPGNCMTRQEVAVVLAKMLKLNVVQDKELSFADAHKIPDWSRGYIKAVVDKGIIAGYKDNTFKPENQVTRAEMAVMIIKALNQDKGDEGLINFTDSYKVKDWAKGYIAKALELKLINGYDDNTFSPSESITRAEVSVIISKALYMIK
jgi:S-layer homology domain